ncbi:MAG: hypothetical protein JRD87_00575 [Deltaproteobacteria bacterium]|jgi:hypothetical protein|nr:hypothetical protein [Deltaproteobacteria bacterium]MBW2668379.1 hypothetical protein [Deltaproteobacteria bacterium]
MAFKENLLKKIEIDKMAQQVIASMGPLDSGRKIDKTIMRSLLEMTDYTYKRKRDLDLYIEDVDSEKTRILVLDNDLAIYHTSIYDVAMRKTPTVKEMMNPYNIIKILKDTDVVMSKKAASVSTIQKECIAKLNLFFDASDIDEIAEDGLASLGKEYTDGVIESLGLFAEILNYSIAPKAFRIRHNKIVGALTQKENREDLFGPMVIYSMIHNTIKLIDERIGGLDKDKIEFFQKVAAGMQKASAEGPDVFQYLKVASLKLIPTTQNRKEEV